MSKADKLLWTVLVLGVLAIALLPYIAGELLR